ncbi:unnamed protein product [Litomosoides sigmodontis]|uniref:Uncharacterized protein n=1 Tax=Litomosoides sigmodontis TaxID=42156 RepID=A0A3P6SFX5_LITSI|nr:unnamed protein product [Litomosoides sigmodontis]
MIHFTHADKLIISYLQTGNLSSMLFVCRCDTFEGIAFGALFIALLFLSSLSLYLLLPTSVIQSFHVAIASMTANVPKRNICFLLCGNFFGGNYVMLKWLLSVVFIII